MKTFLENRRPLFWDVPEADIKSVLENSPEWVVPRVFEYGSLPDIDEVIDLYGAEKVKAILLAIDMKPVTRSMAFLFLGIDEDGRYAA